MVNMLSRVTSGIAISCLLVDYRLADASAQCFFPNGTTALDWFQPCNVVAGEESMCCRISSNTPAPPDTCLPNGLCLGSDKITISATRAPIRSGGVRCAFEGSAMSSRYVETMAYFPSRDEVDHLPQDLLGNAVMTKCSDGSFCCGRSNQTCCDQKLGVSLAATLGGQTSATSTSSPWTSSPSSTSSSSTSPWTGSAVSTTSASNSTAWTSSVAVGVGVGVSALVVLIALSLTGWCLWRSLRRRRSSAENDDDGSGGTIKPELDCQTNSVTSPPLAHPSVSGPVSQPTAVREIDETNGHVSEAMSRPIQLHQHL